MWLLYAGGGVLGLAAIGLAIVVGYFVVMAVVYLAAVPLGIVAVGVMYVLAGVVSALAAVLRAGRDAWFIVERRFPRIRPGRLVLVDGIAYLTVLIALLTPTPEFKATMRRSRSLAHPWSNNP
jgi:hypothetical protein